MATTYPNLEQYLKGAVLADRLYKLRRPEEWIRWIALVAVTLLTAIQQWVWAGAAFVGWIVASWLLAALRVKSFQFHSIMADEMKALVPKRMREDLSKGRLEAKIGPEAATILDGCAKSTLVPMHAFVEARMLGVGGSRTYRDAQRQAMDSADTLMRRALETVQPSLIWKTPPTEGDLARLRSLQDQLAELARESEAAAQLVKEGSAPDVLRESLVNLRAFQAAHQEVDADAGSTIHGSGSA